MTKKKISLNERSFRTLKKLKKEHDRYSDLIIRLCETQNPSKTDPLLEYAGIFCEEEDVGRTIEKTIQDHREAHTRDELEF